MADPELAQISTDKREKWMGAEYTIQPLTTHWLNAWVNAEPHPQIKIPEPNPFVPTHLNILPDPMLSKTPSLIAQNDLGIAYYARCSEYQTPEMSARLHILSPELQPNARSQTLISLYCDHLTDLLHPTLSSAAQAGLATSIFSDRSRLHIKIDGLSQKIPTLLQEILKQMPLSPPTLEQFNIYVARLEQEYLNAQKDLSFKQAKNLLDSLINLDKISNHEKLAQLKTIRYEDFLNFHKKLFEKTYTEALFTGNLTLKEAESAWLDVMHALGKTPYSIEEHPQTKVAELPQGPFSIHQTTQVQGHASILLIDEGLFSFNKRAVQEVLLPPLKEAFFNELRTKQKTGYIAFSDSISIIRHDVDNDSHTPKSIKLIAHLSVILRIGRGGFLDVALNIVARKIPLFCLLNGSFQFGIRFRIGSSLFHSRNDLLHNTAENLTLFFVRPLFSMFDVCPFTMARHTLPLKIFMH